MDPLGEKYYSWSGYNYVMDSPVRLVDPDGRVVTDIIDIEKSTGEIIITEAEGDDVVRLVDDGKVLDSYTYGPNKSFASETVVREEEKGVTVMFADIVPGSDIAEKAEAFYRFAAQSDVEFGKLDVQSPSGEMIYNVTTSHDKAVTRTLPDLVRDCSRRGFTGVKQSHSHPPVDDYNESVPSGYYGFEKNNPFSLMPYLKNGRKEGDALNAIQVRELKGFGNTTFEVYAPGNKTLTTYDGVNRAKICDE